MKERFEGDGQRSLIDALCRNEMVGGDKALATQVAALGELVEFPADAKLIVEGAEDNDVFFLVAGTVGIVVKKNEVAMRKAGQVVGEMAAIESSQKRSADVVALETVVAIKLSNPNFLALMDSFPHLWRPIAEELARRLYERNKLIPAPNEHPRLFIISSKEALNVANAIKAQLEKDVFSMVWTDGVFFAGGYPLEALEKAVSDSDFALAIAQPDDIVEKRGERLPTLRDNVLFELGLFMGKLTRFRALLIHPEQTDLALPSDFQGLTVLRYVPGSDADLPDLVKPACDQIRQLVKSRGVRTFVEEPQRLRAGGR